jgi:hypothetical protein
LARSWFTALKRGVNEMIFTEHHNFKDNCLAVKFRFGRWRFEFEKIAGRETCDFVPARFVARDKFFTD